jgi:hypothetical protein
MIATPEREIHRPAIAKKAIAMVEHPAGTHETPLPAQKCSRLIVFGIGMVRESGAKPFPTRPNTPKKPGSGHLTTRSRAKFPKVFQTDSDNRFNGG